MKSIEAIVGAGVDDNTEYIQEETEKWPKQYGINVTPYGFGFSDLEEDFHEQYERFLELVDDVGATAIIGISGFGSVAINGLYDRAEQVKRVVNICGRLREGGIATVPLRWSKERYPSFAQSLQLSQQRLSEVDPNKIMTLRPYLDEIVPPSTVTVPHANNIRMKFPSIGDWLLDPTFLHNYYSRYALRDYGDVIAEFIKSYG